MENITKKEDAFDRNLILLREYRLGSAEAGEELARLNAPLVASIARRFSERGELSDLLECGNIGLVKAMQSFDPDRGCAFSTYATPLIFGEIRRFLRDDGMIKVSREQKRLCALLCSERERRISLGEPTDIASIAAAVGISPGQVTAACKAIGDAIVKTEAKIDKARKVVYTMPTD